MIYCHPQEILYFTTSISLCSSVRDSVELYGHGDDLIPRSKVLSKEKSKLECSAAVMGLKEEGGEGGRERRGDGFSKG